MRTARVTLCVVLIAGMISGGATGMQRQKPTDMPELERGLTTGGLEGEIHGSVPSLNLFAFTFRDPRDFFSFVQMSLVARDDQIAAQLAGFRRHDRVRVKGKFMSNPSGQRHILVSSVEMVKPFAPEIELPPYHRDATLPKDLENKNTERFLVHIANADTGVFVVEYKDAIVPVYVQNSGLLKGLYRGDVVELKFHIQDHPTAPSHLNLNESDAQPLRVVDSIRAKHGTPASLEGALVMFPQSPQIRFNVFAVLEQLPNGLTRQYTLANLDDAATFTKIREKLQSAWDVQSPPDYENGRNKLVSKKLRVRVNGVINEVDPAQANPQVLVASPDDIRVF